MVDVDTFLTTLYFMAERAEAREVVEIEGASHAVGVSHPQEVADVILRALTDVQ